MSSRRPVERLGLCRRFVPIAATLLLASTAGAGAVRDLAARGTADATGPP